MITRIYNHMTGEKLEEYHGRQAEFGDLELLSGITHIMPHESWYVDDDEISAIYCVAGQTYRIERNDEPERTFDYYALIQVGYCVYGIGTTEQAARDDAVQWLTDSKHQTAREAADAAPLVLNGVYGEDLCVVPCTKAIYDKVQANGGDIEWEETNGGICLPEELAETGE